MRLADSIDEQRIIQQDARQLWLGSAAPDDYRAFNDEQKDRLAALINHIRSFGELVRAEVAL